MIFHAAELEKDGEAWREVLRDCLASAGVEGMVPPEVLLESVTGVAAYLAPRAGRVPDDTVRLLLARALWSLGADAAASEVMRTADKEPLSCPLEDPGILSLARLPAGSPDAVWWMAGSGALKPLRLHSIGNGNCWLLDFTRLGVEAWASFDLALLPAARRLVEMLAPTWDGCRGGGGLALSGLEAGGARSGTSVAAYLRKVLDRVAVQRGWPRRPHVVLWRGDPVFSRQRG